MNSAYGAYHSRPAFGRRTGDGPRVQPGALRVAQAAPDRARTESTARFAADDEGFAIGSVLRNAVNVPGANLITFLGLISLAALPDRVIYHTVWNDSLATNLLLRLTHVICGLLLQIAVIRLSLDAFVGKQASFGACIAQALRSFFPIFGMGLIMALPMALSFLLVVAPGVMLAATWSVAIPVRIAEGAGILACLRRSAELTRGHRWKILAVFLVMGVSFLPVLLLMMLLWGVPVAGASSFFSDHWLARPLFDAATGLVMAATYAGLERIIKSVDLAAFD